MGAVALNMMGQTVLSGDAKETSQLVSFQTLINNGITSAAQIGIVYNVNETGADPSTTLTGFTLRIYDTQTNSLVETIDCVGGCPDEYVVFAQGTGGAGYLFNLNDTDGSFATYFANPSRYVIGMAASVSGTDDGPENFYIQNNGAPVPEPATLLLLGTGLTGIAAGVRRRRNKAAQK